MADNTPLHQATVSTIRQFLAAHGAYVVKLAGGLGQKPGLPDIAAALPQPGKRGPAVWVSVEVKTGKAVLSTRQQIERGFIEQATGIYILAHSVDDVEDRLVAEGLVTPTLQRKRAV